MAVPALHPQPELSAPPQAASLRRLARLLRMAEGVWTVALVDEPATQQAAIERLAAAVAPVPLVVRSLATAHDPLALVRRLPAGKTAPVVCLTDVGRAFPDLFGYLDLQRDTLARERHRLVLWMTPAECRQLAEHAPNFFSRLSGVFDLAALDAPLALPAATSR